jgi:HK97 family phage major capsid protein
VRQGSRALLPGADPSLVEYVAKGGTLDGKGGVTVAERPGLQGARSDAKLIDVYTKALSVSTPAGGGVLVPLELAKEVLGLVRARSAIMSMPGVRVVEVAKELDVNSITTGLSASYALENAHAAYAHRAASHAPCL